MGTINHRKVTILPDDPAADISADEWNDALVVRGSDLTGALLARETGAVDGWSAIPAAAGILNCAGAGTLPTWSTSITLTGAINAGSLTTSGAVSAGSLTTTGVVTAGGLLTASGGITTAGNLLFSPDNTYDLGASGATRPRDGYFGRNLSVVGTLSSPTNPMTFDATGAWVLKVGGVQKLYCDSSALVSYFDNAVDLGRSGGNRFNNAYFGTSVSIGTNPATTGAIRSGNNGGHYERNAANTADLLAVKINASNLLQVGVTRTAAGTPASFAANTYVRIQDTAGNDCYLPAMTAAW